MSRKRGGNGGANRRRRRAERTIYVEGGWLSEWPPSRPRNQQRHQQRRGQEAGNESTSDDNEAQPSSVDSEFAEDYVSNAGTRATMDELAQGVDAIASLLQQDVLGCMEDEEEDMADSDDSDDADEESEGSDIDLINCTGRILFPEDEDSGYSSEDEEQPRGFGLHREELRLQNLRLCDSGGGPSIPGLLSGKSSQAAWCSSSAPAASSRRSWQKGVPGEKKRHRKEMIAAKRRDRAARQGIDLHGISTMFENMISSRGDMLALQPMRNKHRALVHKVASAYRLKTGSQGSGKKRFVVVTRTQHTCLPRGDDKERLLKLLGEEQQEQVPSSSTRNSKNKGEAARLARKYKRVARQAVEAARQEKRRHKPEWDDARTPKKKRAGTADQRRVKSAPSFVSRGVIRADDTTTSAALEALSTAAAAATTATTSTTAAARTMATSTMVNRRCNHGSGAAAVEMVGAFEAHTRGFGSRMLARMGFVEGCGLGREGQGITQPLQPSMRPKSLGLGANRDH